MKQRVPVIVGPTASGKTDLAVAVAQKINAQIINADSMQVYRGLDKGTAKPTSAQRSCVRFHLVDVVEPQEKFSAKMFAELARDAISEISSQGMVPLVCGGTGLYIKALFGGLFTGPDADTDLRRELEERERMQPGYLHGRLGETDPEAARRIPAGDRLRLVRAIEVNLKTGKTISELQAQHGFGDRPYDAVMLGLNPPRTELYTRIDMRVEAMFAGGLIDEVKGLLGEGLDPELPALKAIGYRQVARHLLGEYDLSEAVRLVKRDTRRFAKRQLTWFRADPDISWLGDAGCVDEAVRVLSGQRGGDG